MSITVWKELKPEFQVPPPLAKSHSGGESLHPRRIQQVERGAEILASKSDSVFVLH